MKNSVIRIRNNNSRLVGLNEGARLFRSHMKDLAEH